MAMLLNAQTKSANTKEMGGKLLNSENQEQLG
jgi:hypothetical protein